MLFNDVVVKDVVEISKKLVEIAGEAHSYLLGKDDEEKKQVSKKE